MTTKQIQLLLAYLGYDVAPDGIFGPKTRAAVKEFQKDYGGISVDGDPGTQTQKALRDAVAYNKFRPEKQPETEKQPVPDKESIVPLWWKDIKHFTRSEFRCPCGKWCNGYPVEPAYALVKLMSDLREVFGKEIIIVPPDGHSGGSGVRCKAYNATLKGSVENSRHLLGKAADFLAPGVAASFIEAELERRKRAGQIHYWYRISPGSYHVDVE